jgi:ABC-type multidrug transport system permease subunit
VFAGLGAISSIPGVIQQRAVYYREKPAFLRPFAYFVGMVLAELPLIILGNLLFGSLVYFLAGLSLSEGGVHFLAFALMYSVSNIACVMFAMMLASAAATTEVANTLVGISLSIFSLFAGFIIPKSSIRWWWIWLHYLSFFKVCILAHALPVIDRC